MHKVRDASDVRNYDTEAARQGLQHTDRGVVNESRVDQDICSAKDARNVRAWHAILKPHGLCDPRALTWASRAFFVPSPLSGPTIVSVASG